MLVDPIVADQPDELSGVYQYVFFTSFSTSIFLPGCYVSFQRDEYHRDWVLIGFSGRILNAQAGALS